MADSTDLRIVFMGTPAFAVPVLEALASQHRVLAAYTRPDAVSGRGNTLRPSPVKELALKLDIPVVTPRSFSAFSADGSPLRDAAGQRVVDAALVEQLAALAPDFVVVAAYGLILPRAILDIPRPRKYRPNACATDCELTCPESRRQPAALLDAPPPVANAKPGQITREVERNNLDGIPPGCINVHASLLPRWRGAAPIQRALLAGDERLGVSIMRMEEGLDTGDFCATASTDGGDKDLAQLTMELGQLGAQALLAVLPDIASGSAVWVSQDQTQATYAEKIAKDELWLSPQLGALDNLRRVRAASEQAPARCLICGKSVTVLAARLGQGILGPALHSPGFQAPVTYRNRQLFLQAADEWLEILELKPDGRQRMSATAFASGVKALQGTDQAAAAWNSL